MISKILILVFVSAVLLGLVLFIRDVRRQMKKMRLRRECPRVEKKLEAEGLPQPTDTCAVTDVSGREVKFKCGHWHQERFAFDIFGLKVEVSEKGRLNRSLCPVCRLAELRKCMIRCAKCGFHIMPGDPVALYLYDKKIFLKPEWVTTVGEGRSRHVIGCLRSNCCPSGGFFAGHWTGDSFKSQFEGGSAAGEAIRTGDVVIVSPRNLGE